MIRLGARATYQGASGTIDKVILAGIVDQSGPQTLYHLRYDEPQRSRDPNHPRHRYVGAVVTAERLVLS